MASSDDRVRVKGVSKVVLKHYDKFKVARDRMEKYRNFSNDFQVVSFTVVDKEALDNVVDMFNDEDAQKLIRSHISILKKQKPGGDANLFRGSSKPSSKRYYKYMFIAKVNDDNTVNFNLCSMKKQGNRDVMKTMTEICEGLVDDTFQFLTGAFLIEGAKAVLIAWGEALGLKSKQIRELELGEFVTEFDMTKRLIEGNYCKLVEETQQLFFLN